MGYNEERLERQQKVTRLKDKIRKECTDLVTAWGWFNLAIEVNDKVFNEVDCERVQNLFALQRLMAYIDYPDTFMTEYHRGKGDYVLTDHKIDLYLLDSCNIPQSFLIKLAMDSEKAYINSFEFVGTYLNDKTFESNFLTIIEEIILEKELGVTE